MVTDYNDQLCYASSKLMSTTSPKIVKAYAFSYAFHEALKWIKKSTYLKRDVKVIIDGFLHPNSAFYFYPTSVKLIKSLDQDLLNLMAPFSSIFHSILEPFYFQEYNSTNNTNCLSY